MADRSTASPAPIRLADYRPPAWWVDHVDLRFELDPQATEVRARLAVRRNPDAPAADLHLDGQDLELLALQVDGRTLAPGDYRLGDEGLDIPGLPERCTLEVRTRIAPQDNTALEGLYMSNGMYTTQCEAEGFRRITYYPDRPDVMARFSTTIVADRASCPVLLSNGNPVEDGAEGDRHWVRWEDPFPKPCYLFALVAGDLTAHEDRYTTRSGREVALQLWVEHRNRDKCEHAMRSLKEAMAWDEATWGLEYDLDIYMIVAVDHFNMGAMENKGLNIFNSKYVLARADTATDDDFVNIQGVIGHEYFHNWTGNRVTCRDWFQLSLKEGLTVFRDQEFSADMQSRAVKRIGDVRFLRTAQFAEDSGPMAHPVRPDAYIEINNFYTLTVYEKGAEVIRMIQTLVGRDGFRRGLELYFQRHDGQAVTTDDFVAAMADANGIDLGQFRRWYSQAGTPELRVAEDWDADAGTWELTLDQHTPPTPGQPEKAPLHVPLRLGLLGSDGQPLPLRLEGEPPEAASPERLVELRAPREVLRFVGLPERPVPSLLRGFSAPVKVLRDDTDAELALRLAHDPDPFNRWDAGQRLATRVLLARIAAGEPDAGLPDSLVEAVARVLEGAGADPAFAAECLALPSEGYLAEQVEVIDPIAIHQARRGARRRLAGALRRVLVDTYEAMRERGPYRLDPASIGRRRLAAICLGYLMELGGEDERALALAQYRSATNMTDTMAALSALAASEAPERGDVLEDFYRRWQEEPLVVDKWLAVQATAPRPDALDQVRELLMHPAFDLRNPNRVRAVIGAFAHANPVGFHAHGGAGYDFVAEQILRLDPLNPQVAARLANAFSRWRRYAEPRRELMREQLQRIYHTPKLSPDVYEVAHKSLAESEGT